MELRGVVPLRSGAKLVHCCQKRHDALSSREARCFKSDIWTTDVQERVRAVTSEAAHRKQAHECQVCAL